MYGLSPVNDVHSAKQRSIKLIRRTVSNNPAGILFNEEQAAKQAVNTMLVVVVPIDENSPAGMVSSAEHSAKVSSNLSILGQPAKRLSGKLFSSVQAGDTVECKTFALSEFEIFLLPSRHLLYYRISLFVVSV